MNDQEHSRESDDAHSPNRFSAEQVRRETGHGDKEEYASELTVPSPPLPYSPTAVAETESLAESREETEEGRAMPRRRALGYAALAMGILSLFFWPVFFGAMALSLGIVTFFQGNRALGTWAVILGLISLTGYFILVPLYA